VNLASHTYKDAKGKNYTFSCVAKAKELILTSGDHEYLPIEGSGAFTKAASGLAFNGTTAYNENRVASIQTVGGTGGMRLALDFVKRFFPGNKEVFISRPARYQELVKDVGLALKKYTYYDDRSKSIDIALLLEEIDEAPRGSVFIFQASGHNPTSTDLTPDQWRSVQDVMASRRHLAILDVSNQGLVHSLEQDIYPVSLFTKEENPLIVVQSFSSSMGLAGERAGCLHVVCDSKSESDKVLSQLKIIARPMYSNPPIFGSRIVSTVLQNPELRKLWTQELKGIVDRVQTNKVELVKTLKEKGSSLDWSHLIAQKGIFAYTGLSPEQCNELVDKFHVYVQLDGRISVSGVNQFNVEYVAEALECVTRYSKKI
jgi:aspartate aminotransferase